MKDAYGLGVYVFGIVAVGQITHAVLGDASLGNWQFAGLTASVSMAMFCAFKTFGINPDAAGTQIGFPIDERPPEQTLQLYRRLMTGLCMVAEGNTQGFDLLREDTNQADVLKILEDRWKPNSTDQISGLHGYWRTAVLRTLDEARKKSAVPKTLFGWVEHTDPVLYGAMVTAHAAFTLSGSEFLVLHYKREKECGHACVFDSDRLTLSGQ